MKKTVETYEQGTGRLIDTSEIDVPDEDTPRDLEKEVDGLKARIVKLEKQKPT